MSVVTVLLASSAHAHSAFNDFKASLGYGTGSYKIDVSSTRGAYEAQAFEFTSTATGLLTDVVSNWSVTNNQVMAAFQVNATPSPSPFTVVLAFAGLAVTAWSRSRAS